MLPSIRINFHPLETVFPNNNGTTVDCTIREGHFNYKGIVYDSIEYAFDYAESIAEACFFCCPKSSCCGYHLGDHEKVILLKLNNNIEHVYFNAHGVGEGMWKRWQDCDKDTDGNLIAYVSRGNHAFYPEPKTYLRIFGFSNDQCSNRGLSLKTNITGLHTDEHVPRQHSITPTERFFLAFVVLCLRNGA
jgi:hypothetical protein